MPFRRGTGTSITTILHTSQKGIFQPLSGIEDCVSYILTVDGDERFVFVRDGNDAERPLNETFWI